MLWNFGKYFKFFDNMNYLDPSPALLTSDDFVTSNEKYEKKMADLLSNQPFCSNNLMISSEHRKSR